MKNHEIITKSFDILLNVLAPFVAQELGEEYGSNVWWREGVMKALYDDQKFGLPQSGDYATLVDSLDIQRCLTLLDIHWNDGFRHKLTTAQRNWAKELQQVRNQWAHSGGADISDDDTWRALDTMSRFCDVIDHESAEEIRTLQREYRYGSAAGSTVAAEPLPAPEKKLDVTQKKASILLSSPYQGLPGWRQIIQPHPDVAEGRYHNAEFSANLGQVAIGEGTFEYRDPTEFFSRTYVTEGMKGLLKTAINRVTGKSGEPVIQLKTAFGGGKTHSLLAIYHLMRSGKNAGKLPGISPILQECGAGSLPEVNVAVLDCTALDPCKKRIPANLPGITVSTLWGEMAYQLALSSGKHELYNIVKESDKKGISPGWQTLRELFDACGPCVILIDELVAYARKLYGQTGQPAGTFENQLTFIQELTEGAKASKNSLVIATIPESEKEVGGEAGEIALERVEHTFGRLEAIWKPVTANEGFEIVRRRLFNECRDPEARSVVCQKFSDMYLENRDAFPVGCSEVEYRKRLESCYPFHPELFDRLYDDWATLENFQKTRGVLRLMAALVHNLWINQDNGLMIMPGSLTLDDPSVKEELVRYVEGTWNSIIDNEVDGKNSVPFQKDNTITRFGACMAARRVARTIMLGSAPSSKAQNLRGIEKTHVMLGTVQPGENVATFSDALSKLQESLAYLYSNPDGGRFWYDTRPTLRKTAEDRASQIKFETVDCEIIKELHSIHKEPPFGGVNICPNSSLDVPDEQTVRLVILRPDQARNTIEGDNDAVHAAENIFNTHGSSPRIYRNMLAFVAPSSDGIASLRDAVRKYLAWQSIQEESTVLNLDAHQTNDVRNNLSRSKDLFHTLLNSAYCWLLVPNIDPDEDISKVVWEEERLSSDSEISVLAKAGKKMMEQDALITNWSPAILKMTMDDWLWKEKDSIAIKSLWNFLTTYCYLPRLANREVLEDTIRHGVNSKDYFAYADSFDGTRYTGLVSDKAVDVDCSYGLLVKLGAAKDQMAKEQPSVPVQPIPPQPIIISGGDGEGPKHPMDVPPDGQPPIIPPVPQKRHFAVTAKIDNTRVINDVHKLYDEIISQLASLDGSNVEITLHVEASVDSGIDAATTRTLTENCRTLKTNPPELY